MRPSSSLYGRSALAASLAATLLAGCGGAGTSLPASPPGAQFDARQTGAAPDQSQAISNPYPATTGDVFVFAYDESDAVKSGGTTTTTTVTGKDTVRVLGNKSFDGQSLMQFKENLTYTDKDANGNVLSTGTNSSDRFRQFASVNGGKNIDYYSYGDRHTYVEKDADGSTLHESGLNNYGASTPYILDILPETKGQSWNPEIGFLNTFTTKKVKAGVTTTDTEKYTLKDDGSYERDFTSSTPGDGEFKETDIQSGDGSGSDVNNGKTISTAGSTTFSAPKKSGSKYLITVVYTPPTGSQTTTQVPDWFPGNGPPKSLVTDEREDSGTAKVPTDCGKATAGQTAELLVESYSALDIVLGTYETFTDDTYVVAGEGIVCVTESKTTNTYDNRDTGALTSAETVTSTTGLTSETLKTMLERHLTVGFAPNSR
jgi:hypothetical protein